MKALFSLTIFGMISLSASAAEVKFLCSATTESAQAKLAAIKPKGLKKTIGVLYQLDSQCGLEMPLARGVIDYCDTGKGLLTVKSAPEFSVLESRLGKISLVCEDNGRVGF